MKRLKLTEREEEQLEQISRLAKGTNRIPALRLQETDENVLLYAFLLPTNERKNHGIERPSRELGKGTSKNTER